MKHGQEHYFIKGNGWISGRLFPSANLTRIFSKYAPFFPTPKPDPIDRDPQDPPTKPRRIFCRLFGEGGEPDTEALIELGMAMETERSGNLEADGDSDIPAGFTYFGQFVDHDITADPTPLSVTESTDPSDIMNGRSPALDLDSLYGKGPVESQELYESDGLHLRTGRTSPTVGREPGAPIQGDFPNDLPRSPDKKAIIGDARNDENLAVAQTHLAFLKFHNKKLDELAALPDAPAGPGLFEAVRREVVLLYQAIVLTDFLPRLVQEDVLADVLENGRTFYTDDLVDCMPIEFSVAAYRLGHSMIRSDYEWNRVFNSKQTIATMELLFEFSEVSGSRGPGDDPFFGKPTLPSNWIIDWTRFYDFSQLEGVQTHPDLNFAREIDTRLSFALQNLPEFQKDGMPAMFLSLATRNLLRGRMLRLPTGQQVAESMEHTGLNFAPITSEEIAAGPHEEILRRHGFHENTPLWYYILREAKITHDGNKLGPVGSRIMAEVFVGLIQNSPTSLLTESPGRTFSMAEMLNYVDDLNPLG